MEIKLAIAFTGVRLINVNCVFGLRLVLVLVRNGILVLRVIGDIIDK